MWDGCGNGGDSQTDNKFDDYSFEQPDALVAPFNFPHETRTSTPFPSTGLPARGFILSSGRDSDGESSPLKDPNVQHQHTL